MTANRLWSHFSQFHYFDTVTALWLSAAVQLDWSVRLKLSVPRCTQGAYSPAVRQPQNLLSNNSSGDAAQKLDSWPANQRDSYFKPHIAASGPPLSLQMPLSHVTEKGLCGELRFFKVLCYTTRLNHPVRVRAGEMVAKLLAWTHECAIVARKHCLIKSNANIVGFEIKWRKLDIMRL